MCTTSVDCLQRSWFSCCELATLKRRPQGPLYRLSVTDGTSEKPVSTASSTPAEATSAAHCFALLVLGSEVSKVSSKKNSIAVQRFLNTGFSEVPSVTDNRYRGP
jgi:hypothetical protein